MTPGVSIVIPTWNGLDLLKRFLPSVIAASKRYGKQSYAPTEIIIVDDGSSDATVEWLTAQGFVERGPGKTEVANQGHRPGQLMGRPASAPRHTTPAFLLIKNETNRGFGEACNRGFEAASSPLVLLLNNDVELDEGAIAPLVENFEDA